jgi:hypothetical protein
MISAKLKKLEAKATKGPWKARPEYGCRNPEDWEVAPDIKTEIGVTTELLRTWNYEKNFNKANAELIAYLRNHAQDFIRLMEAAEEAHERWETPNWKDAEYTAHVMNKLRKALAAFKEKS